ncbi:hypothetical protein MXB_4687 [Myxobolus squamalis]|nr:hypothetical protein MXB_4687 [Myxobolus squamalis]
MVTSRNPFEHLNRSEMTTNIIDCNYDFPDHVSEDCKMYFSVISTIDLLVICLQETLEIVFPLNHYPLINGISSLKLISSLVHHKFDHISSCYYLLAESLVKKAMNLDFPICLAFNPEVFNCEIEREKNNVTTESRYKRISDSMNDISKYIDKEIYIKSPIKKRKSSKLSTSNLVKSVNETRRFSMQAPLPNADSSVIHSSNSPNDLTNLTVGKFPKRVGIVHLSQDSLSI